MKDQKHPYDATHEALGRCSPQQTHLPLHSPEHSHTSSPAASLASPVQPGEGTLGHGDLTAIQVHVSFPETLVLESLSEQLMKDK